MSAGSRLHAVDPLCECNRDSWITGQAVELRLVSLLLHELYILNIASMTQVQT